MIIKFFLKKSVTINNRMKVLTDILINELHSTQCDAYL